MIPDIQEAQKDAPDTLVTSPNPIVAVISPIWATSYPTDPLMDPDP